MMALYRCRPCCSTQGMAAMVTKRNFTQTTCSDDKLKEASLYVHWPYCAKRCTYCNFNKYISKNVDHQRMASCLAKEAATLLQLSGVSRITSIFFGGGTPSLALPSTVQTVIDTVRDHVTLVENAEVTLEANPSSLMTKHMRKFKKAGVNRLSLGVQALNNKDLKVLGRDHSVTESLRCLDEARKVFPGRVSTDLIFGRPGQTLDQWEGELKQLMKICDDHVSLYQLTLERGTMLFKWIKEENRYCLPDNDLMADMYNTAVQVLESSDLTRYEVSNFAKKGAESHHNLGYWRGNQYIGIGPGAHGRFVPSNWCGSKIVEREARIQTLEPDNWMSEVEKFGHATRKIVQQSQIDRLEELLSLGLRTVEGVSTKTWDELSPFGSLHTIFHPTDSYKMMVEEGLLILDARGLRATSNGLMLLDSITPFLLATLSQYKDVVQDSTDIT